MDRVTEDEWDQVFRECGYEWCRPCREWHRPPECPIDQDGRTSWPGDDPDRDDVPRRRSLRGILAAASMTRPRARH